jgi:small-conductance mechanosensitive channel
MGVNVSALVASLGLTGFALGFALKDALSNLLAGALILIYQPFRCGDTIKVAGCEGEVTEINLRYTILRGDGKTHLIPNATLYTNTVDIADKEQ